eukprot:scaffold1396_cov252-Pinguiococcus_pyrenoidosus.AAC.16
MRHYCIRATPAGVNRGVRKVRSMRSPLIRIVGDPTQAAFTKWLLLVVDRSCGRGCRIWAGWMTSRTVFWRRREGAAAGTKETPSNRLRACARKVVLPERYTGRGNNKSQRSTVRLSELGPRVTMKLWKVERGMAEGDVLYHAHVVKTPEEAAAARRKAYERQQEKKRRREEQEGNVMRKKQEKEAKKAKRELRRQERAKRRADALERGDPLDEQGDDDDDDDEEEDGDDAVDGEEFQLNRDITDGTDEALVGMEALDMSLPEEPEADFDYSDTEGQAPEYENEDDD